MTDDDGHGGDGNRRPNDHNDSSSPSSISRQDPAQRTQQQHQHQRRRLEHVIIQDFDRVLVKQISSIGAKDFMAGDAEKEFVVKFLRSVGVAEGLAAAAFAFYGLNRFPRHFARYMTRRKQQQQPQSQQQKQNYVLDKTTTPTPTTKQSASPFQNADANKKVLEQQVVRKRTKFLFTAMELTFDVGMSIGVGICAASMTTDRVEAMKTATDVPLQPGRSFLSEQCCPSLLEEYQRQWKIKPTKEEKKENKKGRSATTDIDNPQWQRRDILQGPEHETLRFLKILTQNCRHRQVMEEQLRDDQMLPLDPEESAVNAPIAIAIPASGVIPQTEDPLLEMMTEEEGLGIDYILGSGSSWSHEQAHSWVDDQ